MKTKKVYQIWWVSQYGRELVDETDSRKDASYLVDNYKMAYGGYVYIKTVRESITNPFDKYLLNRKP